MEVLINKIALLDHTTPVKTDVKRVKLGSDKFQQLFDFPLDIMPANGTLGQFLTYLCECAANMQDSEVPVTPELTALFGNIGSELLADTDF